MVRWVPLDPSPGFRSSPLAEALRPQRLAGRRVALSPGRGALEEVPRVAHVDVAGRRGGRVRDHPVALDVPRGLAARRQARRLAARLAHAAGARLEVLIE